MAIIAQYGNIVVEVVDVLTTGDNRKRAVIRALEGEPFTVTTHGGPMNTDAAVVDPALLVDVHQVNQYGTIRRSRRAGAALPELAYVPLEDSAPAAVFPVRSRGRQPWKGANSD